ncbi:MAG: hypothetical protein WC731_05865 [Candidatus Omnitrophota bacterium]|jgi:hypothetical protein
METNSRINIKIIYPDIKKTIVATFKFLIKNLFTRGYKGLRYTKIDGYWEELYVDKEILEKIKKLKGIYYTETGTDNLLFIRRQKLDNSEIEEIFYWTEFYGRWDLTIRIFGFLGRCSYERRKFLKKGTIEGRGVFHGFISPRFWLKWDALYHVIDKKKAIEAKFSDELLFIRGSIDLFIQSSFSNYIFEIGKTGSSSLIREPPSSLSVSQGIIFCPKYSTIFEILEEIRNKIIAPYFNTTYGVELRTLVPVEFGPIDEPKLGLWESDTKEGNKLKEELLKKLLLKTKESQIPQKENSVELLNEEISIKPQKLQQLELSKMGKPKIDFIKQGFNIGVFSDKVNEKINNAFKKRKQMIPLLKFWLESRSRIHWLYGFIMFSNWRKNDLNHMNAFSQCMSHLRNLGTKTGLWTIEIASTEKGDILKKGHWKLEGVRFSSNISEAQKLFDEAVKCEEGLNKKTNLIKACEAYPEYLDAHLLLAGCWEKEGFKNLNFDEIKQARRFFVEKEAIYSDAITTVIQLQLKDKSKKSYWNDGDIAEVIDEMGEKFQKIKHFAMILEKWCKEQKALSQEEETCERIKALIENKNYALLLKGESIVKKAIGNTLYHLGWEESDYDREADLINALTEIYKEGTVNTEKTEVISKVYEVFTDLIINRTIDTNCLKAGDSEGFKKYLTAALLKETRRIAGKEHPIKEILTDDPHKFAKKSQEIFSKDTEDIPKKDTPKNTSL